jgi:hypothetical protein
LQHSQSNPHPHPQGLSQKWLVMWQCQFELHLKSVKWRRALCFGTTKLHQKPLQCQQRQQLNRPILKP